MDIFVTNNNDFVHEDRFNGTDYVFPPKEKVHVSEEAAIHMFGLGEKDKTETLVRLGWAMRFNEEKKRFEENPEGVEKLRKFVFSRARLVEDVLPDGKSKPVK